MQLKTTATYFIPTFLILLLHLLSAPYTKVEESFNTQAIHDLIYSPPRFDHLDFPGVVPRTFLIPLCVSFWCQFLKGYISKHSMLIMARTVIGFWTALSLAFLCSSIHRKHGKDAGIWMLIFNTVQFHVMFWGSRPLANVFALILFNFAFGLYLGSTGIEVRVGTRIMVVLMIFVSLVVRVELIPLTVVMISRKLFVNRFPVISMAFTCFASAAVSIGLSYYVDSYYWQRPLWPEFEVFMFNGIQNKSVEWGVSPWYFYFSNLVPRIAPLALPLSLIGLLVCPREVAEYVLLALIHIQVLSRIPHKEWRFVVYCVPLLNAVAAITVSKLYKSKSKFKRFAQLVLIGATILIAVGSGFMNYVSHHNYPGGLALFNFNQMITEPGPCHVHMDTFTAMTGASRFLENEYCQYSKAENLTRPEDYLDYTHLITSTPKFHQDNWKVVETIRGYAGLQIVDPKTLVRELTNWRIGQPIPMPVVVLMKDMVYIMTPK